MRSHVAPRRLAAAVLAACGLGLAPAPALGATACTPGGAPLTSVPTWDAVNGFPLGTRQATNAEVERYVAAVDAASDRVSAGTAGRSFGGRALPIAYVGTPDHVTEAGRRRIGVRARALRDAAPRTPAVSSADTAIVWITAGVHGNEPSATDGHMRILYELASTTDCAKTVRLDRLLTVIFPMQNPDGRARGQRTNGYRFDLNRDWFARTQPETRVKIDLLEEYPPILYVDGHEQTGDAAFFPPNADPIHHEIADTPLRHINDVYGPPMRAAMEAEGRDYTNYTTYDLFYMGFGDTVPATLYGAAGMTFEKGGQDVYTAKEHEHWLLADTVLGVAAASSTKLFGEWAAQWTEAKAQGAAGALEPNVVVQPTNTVTFPVPRQKTYAYVLRADAHTADAAALVNRLRTVGVEVDRLRRPLRAPGFRAFGSRAVSTVTLPKDTYVVRMNQSRKHWVQALLADDAYVPFPYFYDVSGWSNPLLMGLEGGVLTAPLNARAVKPRSRRKRSILRPVGVGTPGRQRLSSSAAAFAFPTDSLEGLQLVLELERRGVEVRRAREPFEQRGRRFDRGTGVVEAPNATDLAVLRTRAAARRTPVVALSSMPSDLVSMKTPKVAVLRDPVGDLGDTTVNDVGVPVGGTGVAASLASSEGWLRWVLEQRLGVEVVRVHEGELSGLAARGVTALVVPDGTLGGQALSPVGLQAVQAFVRGGGTYVGLRAQGLGVAQAAGLTTATTGAAPSGFQVPGVSIRARVDDSSPVTWGLGSRTWVFNTGDPIVTGGSSGGRVAVAYTGKDELFVSGYAEGTDVLAGTPVVLDERAGSGHAVIFTVDATFRGYVESTERMVVNALLYPASSAAQRRRSRPRAVQPGLVGRTVASVSAASDAVVRVGRGDEDALRAAAASIQDGVVAALLPGGAELRVPGARRLGGHADERLVRLLDALRRAGVRPTFAAL